MAFRSDVSIDWDVSPRIITVASPSLTIIIQDLLDTMRAHEEYPHNMAFPRLARASGKEALGGGLQVGITLILENALVEFEDRLGPSFVQCSVTGGNILAEDANGDAVASPINTSDYVEVVYERAVSAALLAEWTQVQINQVLADAAAGAGGSTRLG